VLMDDESDGANLATDNITPESLLLQLEDSQTVMKALGELPIAYREMILLSDIEELSYKEIAQVLAVPIGTVMSRLSRGRKMLRQALLADSPGRSTHAM
jgi:RNA polymerase sigma-70 factor (ECF subfamily)